MQVKEEIMYRVFEKCEIQIEGQTISKELLLKTFGDFLTQTIAKRDHNVGLVMHTGSLCFDVVLITYATILNLISNKAETGNMVNSFSDGTQFFTDNKGNAVTFLRVL